MTPRRRKLGLLASLYFAQGLPFGFFTQALPIVLRRRGLSLEDVGLAHLVDLPWGLKFLWAPLVDRFGSERLGRRRSWILPVSLLGAAAMAALGLGGDETVVVALIAGALVASVIAATQDVATDALAVDLLREEERGAGNGVQVGGYRVGMIVGGFGLLVVYDVAGWRAACLAMAALLLAATLPVWRLREPPAPRQTSRLRARDVFAFAVRPAAPAWIALVVAYKAGDALGMAMLRPYLVDRGWSLTRLGWALGLVGSLAALAGAVAGGLLTARLGRRRALVAFGVAQALANASYGLVAYAGAGTAAVVSAIVVENLVGAMATVALFAAMMDVTRPAHAAADYTFQTCIFAAAIGLPSAASGFVAGAIGYAAHFALAGALALGGALLAGALHARAAPRLAGDPALGR